MTWDDCCCRPGIRCIGCSEGSQMGTFETRMLCPYHGRKAPAFLIRRNRDGTGKVLCGWNVYTLGSQNVYRRASQHETFKAALWAAGIGPRVAHMKMRPHLVA